MQFRNIKRQYKELKPQIDEAIKQVLDECSFISGMQVSELESRLADYVGVRHCIACASGTDALRLSLMAYGIGNGDAVFVPDFTFFATAEMPAALDAVPIFVDVRKDTYNIDIEKLEASICKVEAEGELRPRAIIAADLFGQCAEYKAINDIAKNHNLIIIEDAAQSFGGKIEESRAGSFGDIAATSFFPSKPLGCYGDGGAVFTNDNEIAALIRSYAVHGKGSDKYNNIRIGLNSRLDTIQAAILLVKLEAFISHELEDINKIADYYSKNLEAYVTIPVINEGYYSSWAQFTIQLANIEQRNAVQKQLKENGIPSMVYYPKGLHSQEAFSGVKLYDDFKVTNKLCETVLSLPIYPYMSSNEVEKVVYGIKKCL